MIILCSCGQHYGDNKNDTIRADIAINLFFGEGIRSIPRGHGRLMIPFSNWLWAKLGEQQGHINPERREKTVVRIPDLDKSSLDFLLRICSFWSNEVFTCQEPSVNKYIPPIVNINDDPGLFVRSERGMIEKFFTPRLGPSRLFIRYEKLSPNSKSARLHSHSAIDEFYFIIRGRGHANINGKLWEIKGGDLIGKPRGPDVSTCIIADSGTEIEILDMEIWPDEHYKEKDVISYPENGEMYIRGEGWSGILPLDAMHNASDIKNVETYFANYKRKADGSKVFQ